MTMMIEPASLLKIAFSRNLLADRHSRDRELLAPPAIRLHERADRVGRHRRPSFLHGDHARGRAVAAFELVGDHPRSAADAAFRDRTALRGLERLIDMFRLHMKAIDVVEIAVPRLRHDRQDSRRNRSDPARLSSRARR